MTVCLALVVLVWGPVVLSGPVFTHSAQLIWRAAREAHCEARGWGVLLRVRVEAQVGEGVERCRSSNVVRRGGGGSCGRG
jgi:hypothetical protein